MCFILINILYFYFFCSYDYKLKVTTIVIIVYTCTHNKIFINISKHNSDNHDDYDNDMINRQCHNLLMVIYDNLFWYQQFVSTLTTKMTIRHHKTNGPCLNPSYVEQYPLLQYIIEN